MTDSEDKKKAEPSEGRRQLLLRQRLERRVLEAAEKAIADGLNAGAACDALNAVMQPLWNSHNARQQRVLGGQDLQQSTPSLISTEQA